MPRSLAWPVVVLASLILLHLGQPILVPLCLAAFLAQLLLPVVSRLERWLPKSVAILLGLALVGAAFAGIVGVISDQAASFQKDAPALQQRFIQLTATVQTFAKDHFGLEPSALLQMAKNALEGSLGAGGQYAMTLVGALVMAAGTGSLVAIFAFLMLYYRRHFHRTLVAICSTDGGTESVAMIEQITAVGQRYVAGLLTVIAVVGILDTIGFFLVKAPFAALFGLLGALAILIPYVGIIVVAPLCSLLTLISTGEPSSALAVLLVYAVIHFLEGNVITPALVGHQVNLNPLASLLAVLIGGELWGPAGMLLFIPMAGMAGLVLEVTPKGKPIAQLIGTIDVEKPSKKKWLHFKRHP